jgi:PD-(D/E)XK nuclease superfamily
MSRPISNSEVQTFLQCRRKWWLSYYRKLRPKPKGKGPLALGTRVHAALAAYYNVPSTNPYEAYKTQLELDRQLVREEEMSDFEKEAELGQRMLDGYFEWVKEHGLDAGLSVVSTEEEISVPSAVPGFNLVGKLDVRVLRDIDGARLFIDHKTAASLTDPLKTLPMDPQMLHYHVLEMLKARQEGTDIRCDGALYNILKKVKRTAAAKPPFYHREEVRHNVHELRSYYQRLTGIIKQISHVTQLLDASVTPLEAAYPSPRRECSWSCEHFAVCPLFDDGSYAEGLIEAAYEKVNPYDRYDLKGEE